MFFRLFQETLSHGLALSTAFEFATLWNDDDDENIFFGEEEIEKNYLPPPTTSERC